MELVRGLIGEALELVIPFGSETALTILRTRLQVRELWQKVLGVVGLVELGLVRRRHCLVFDACPVDLIEPRMRLYLICISRSATQTCVSVLVQQFGTQIAGFVRQKGIVKPRLSILNILVELLAVFRIEGWEADKHLVNDGSKGPPIRGLPVTLSLEHLGREVLGGAAKGLGLAMSCDSHL